MFTLIERHDQLPEPGKVNEQHHLDFKAEPTDDAFEIAKDVAAFANAEGGTLLIGARGRGEYLSKYEPLTRKAASQAQRTYEEAVRDRCSPAPLFNVNSVPYDDGFVMAVNVWAFPGQLVGVEVKQGEAKCGKKASQPEGLFFFPLRVGTHTKAISPEQLAMFMDPRVRRIAMCLGEAKGQKVTVFSSKCDRKTHWTEECVVEDVDFMGNAVAVRVVDDLDRARISIPLDLVESVWRSKDRWNLLIAGHIEKWLQGSDGYPPETGGDSYFFTSNAPL